MEVLHYPLAFLAMLGVLVTFHEFGHYLVARLSGVHILRFSVGFGRPILKWVDRRGTEFVLSILPLGGYLRMLDDSDPEQQITRPAGAVAANELHPKWRIAIALGGPIASFFLAFLIFFILFIVGSYKSTPFVDIPEAESALAAVGVTAPAQVMAVDGVTYPGWQEIGLALASRLGETGNIDLTLRDLASHQQRIVQIPIERWHEGEGEPDLLGSLGLLPQVMAVVGEVEAGSPADLAGLRSDDFIVQAGGSAITNWFELVEQIEAHPATPMTLTYYRQGVALNTMVTPAKRQVGDKEVGRLGIGTSQNLVRFGFFRSIPAALGETWNKTVMTVAVVKKMITGQVSVKNLAGPITIAQVAGQSARYGWRQFLFIMAFLSISLGVLNLLPVPILDGGHVVFHSVEWISGKPVSERLQIMGVQIGLFLVGSLFLLATYNDVLRLF